LQCQHSAHEKNTGVLFFTFIWLFIKMVAQKQDKKLTRNIKDILSGCHGTVGVYVKNLKTGKTSSANGATIFPPASMMKVPILLGLFDKMGRRSYYIINHFYTGILFYVPERTFFQIPPYIFTASKNGAVNKSRSETILVMSLSGPYVFSIITKNFVPGSNWKSHTIFLGTIIYK
jgi:hypothetical protein